MAGMTGDLPVVSYGLRGGLTAWPVGDLEQLYIGEVALIDTTGNLKNAATAGSTDTVVGMLDAPAGGTYVQTGPGIVGGTADGDVWMDVAGGAFMIQSGSGADQLSAATNGKTVYYGGENASGPIACATGVDRPVLGIQLPQDPGFAGGASPGPNYWPIVLNAIVPPGV